MEKNKILQIRITEEKYNRLHYWAERFKIKTGPFCLFILMEKLDHLDSYEKVFEDPDIITQTIELIMDQKKDF